MSRRRWRKFDPHKRLGGPELVLLIASAVYAGVLVACVLLGLPMTL